MAARRAVIAVSMEEKETVLRLEDSAAILSIAVTVFEVSTAGPVFAGSRGKVCTDKGTAPVFIFSLFFTGGTKA